MEKGAHLKICLAMVLIALVIISTAQGEIIYVDDDVNGANDGSSWADAYNGLQDALAVAQSGDEIRVAQGIYRPTGPSGARTATFQLKNGVVIKGGYPGFGESELNVRDIQQYETVLSGDLNGNDVLVTNLEDLLYEPTRAENCYHIVTGSGTDLTAVLDGFTVTGGNADGSYRHENGAGMYNESGSPMVRNCIFIRNAADYHAGGMYNTQASKTKLTSCTFIKNYGRATGGGITNNHNSRPTLVSCAFSQNSTDSHGGAMRNIDSSPTLTNCTFIENSATRGGGIASHTSHDSQTPCDLLLTNCTFKWNLAGSGGGMYSYHTNAMLNNCIFIGNSAEYHGGGMYNHSTSPMLKNCIFNSNWAGQFGGGTHNWNYSNAIFENCTFSGNSAGSGGAICSRRECNPILSSCILWGNTATEGNSISIILYESYTSAVTVGYSDIESGRTGVTVETGCLLIWGEGNIDANPCFVAPGHWVPPQLSPFASEPNPADGAMVVNINADLSWTTGHDAVSHDVYFGTSTLPPFVCNQTATIFDPGTMAYDTTYYWRIDEVYGLDTITGDLWGFTTIMSPPSPPPLLTQAASYMSNTQQYTWIEGDYNLLVDSPCIDAGDPNHPYDPKGTDLSGKPRVIGCQIDMGAFEYMKLIPAGVRIVPHNINLANKGRWITCYIWLPESYNIADIDFCILLLEYEIEPEQFWFNEEKKVVVARFNHEQLQGILDIGAVELTINAQLTDGTVFEGTDIIKVIHEGGGKLAKYGKASNPNPSDGAKGVSITADLSWTAGSNATSHDVYFGTSSTPPFVCNQIDTIFDPGTMAFDTTYFWRIDEFNKWGKATGQVWSFTTGPSPGLASNPSPSDGAIVVDPNTDLSWTASLFTESHDVYFGTSSTPTFIGNQTSTTFDPGTMTSGTTYYWRIDEVNKWGKTTGELWSFLTITPYPP